MLKQFTVNGVISNHFTANIDMLHKGKIKSLNLILNKNTIHVKVIYNLNVLLNK